MDIGEGVKPAGYYVQRSSGLFPAPLPQSECPTTDRVVKIFKFFGILLAKVLQDNRLVDLPLSTPFLKLMCHGEVKQNIKSRLSVSSSRISMSSVTGCGSGANEDDVRIMTESETDKELLFDPPKHYCHALEESPWFDGILTPEDWTEVNPHHGKILASLKNFIQIKQKILNDLSLSEDDKKNQLQNLTLTFNNDDNSPVKIEDLG